MYEEFKGNLRKFVDSGYLRYALEKADVPGELIEKVINRCIR
jgi:hypothetical protein